MSQTITPKPDKPRIEYIDLMKGICIILVVFYHADCWGDRRFEFGHQTLYYMLQNFFMALFFFLSGVFFSSYSCFADFLTRKAQKLLLPYFFFCVFPNMLVYGIDAEQCHWWIVFAYTGNHLPYTNGPVWFAMCLFVCYILYWLLMRCTSRWHEAARAALLATVTFVTLIVCRKLVDFDAVWTAPGRSAELVRLVVGFLHLQTALVVMPFFYSAHLLHRYGWLNRHLRKRTLCLLFALFATVCALTATDNVDLHSQHYGDSVGLFYVAAFSGIGALWCVCRLLGHLPVVSYMGRYSLIVLGMHSLFVCLTIDHITANTYLITFLVVLLLLPVIWLMRRFFPHVTAQKDLFVWRDGRLRLIAR